MLKEYIFKYAGSKESFLTILMPFSNNGRKLYFIDQYMIEVHDDEIRFGVERAGHSGGRWLVSKFTEENNQIEFRGTIQYIRSNDNCTSQDDNRTRCEKVFDTLGTILLYILMVPIAAVVYVISWVIRKILKKPITTEDKLYDLMINRLNCQSVNNEKK